MLENRRPGAMGSWYRVARSSQALAAHGLLLSLTALLVMKLNHRVSISWWMCRDLMPSDEEGTNDEAIWETIPHFWVAISMVFLVAATILLVLKLTGDVGASGWWEIFINFGIAECFSFLVCTKWSNPAIHCQPHQRGLSSSSEATRYLDWNSGLVVTADENETKNHLCAPKI